MKVLVAEYAGVCFGVRRALDLLEESVEKANRDGAKVVMLGPLIHNPRVVENYSEKGVDVVDVNSTPEEGVVVLRSHGVTKQAQDRLERNKALDVVDTTCPYVKRIHQLVEKRSLQGIAVIVMGDKTHSEVEGITSRISGPFMVVSPELSESSILAMKAFLDKYDKVFVVAQTTSRPVNYEKLVREIKKIIPERKKVDVSQTICTATLKRQDSARELSSRVDAIVVVGGKNSSNTSKLFQVVSINNKNSFWVEKPQDFTENDIDILRSLSTVGITAGASTPDNQIMEMKEFLESLR